MHAPAAGVARMFAVAIAIAGCLSHAAPAQSTLRIKVDSGEPQWIWSATHPKDKIPTGVCLFRKTFNLGDVEQARVQVTCDDRYDLYINGRLVGSGTEWKKLKTFPIERYLQSGKNAIAIRAENTTEGSAGLVVRLTVKQKADTEVSYSTDATWKTSSEEVVGWEKLTYDDSEWSAAQALGEFGSAAPWTDQVTAADGTQVTRFTISPEFRVERVLGSDTVDSLIAMTFNEFGDILASSERGPLWLISDEDKDGIPEKVTTYCSEVTSCQGILALSGSVFAVGQGPEGAGLYRLTDDNNDRKIDTVKNLLKFSGELHEHGPHACVLGPDGLIYVIIGNHTSCESPKDTNSPHHDWYEGDLVQPRYEDAGGHAVGVKAPGGVVLRTDTEGSFVQIVAGGFRNAYDIAFNRQGDLFTFDSDMEWDEGLPWYRPTRINQVVAGGEFGWRSGWANWPDYFFDNLPSTLDVGRGSPTGVVVYNHYMLPARYHNAMFACDWAQGRILAIKLTPSHGTYQAASEVFLEGRPLSVTDIEVGPDGWLYFCTGGRGTDGGVYRVVWTGRVPPRPQVQGAVEAIYLPQLDSAWARQKAALIQQKAGPKWARDLIAIADNAKNKPEDRTRALELMELLGPFPAPQQLVKLSRDRNQEVRAKVAYLMGLHVDQNTAPALVALLKDPDPTVRRVACESVARGGAVPPFESLQPLLADPNRVIAFAAGRALQRLPAAEWQDKVITSRDLRVFLIGSAALMSVAPERDTAIKVCERCGEWMKGYVKDGDFVDLLRLMQITLHRAELKVDDVPSVAAQLEREYPSRDLTINRELMRLLVHLQQSDIIPRVLEELHSDDPLPDRLHAAMYARFLDSGWTTGQKLDLLEFYEQNRDLPGGHSYALYLDNFGRDFLAKFGEEERRSVIERGDRMPTSALICLASLPEDPGTEVLDNLLSLDRRMESQTSPAAERLRIGIVAVLARSRTPKAMAYLRDRFELEPNRRREISVGLAQDPTGENWPILVRSLSSIEGGAAQEVMARLTTVDRRPEETEAIRQAIQCGLKMQGNGALQASALLRKWTGESVGQSETTPEAKMLAWQKWFSERYPDLPPAALPNETAGNKWTVDELLSFLESTDGSHGDPQRGMEVFDRAQCVRCHRFGSRGEGVGPELTSVTKRFQTKEILESVIHPSQVISDQYASKTVQTERGMQFTGIVGEAGLGAIVVLQPNGEKIMVPKNEIAQMIASPKSAMPEGLFNNLSLDEIADLLAFLSAPPRTPAVAEQPDSKDGRRTQR